MGAGLRQNIGRTWGPQAWKQMTTSCPNQVFIDVVERSAEKLNKDNKRKATEKVKSKRRKSKYTQLQDTPEARRAYSRHDGGITPDDITEDLSQESLDQLKSSFYETNVVITSEEANKIEQLTRDQADSDEWKSERRKMITASKVGGICKISEKTKRSNKYENYCTAHSKGTRPQDMGQKWKVKLNNNMSLTNDGIIILN